MNGSLQFFQKVTRDADSYIPFHAHHSFELVYYVSGCGTTQIGKQKYEYEAGCFAIIQPGCLHDEYRRTTTDVIFLGFFWNNALIPLDNGIYRDEEDSTNRKLLNRIAKELAGKSKYYDLMIQGLLTELVAGIGRSMNSEAIVESDNHLSYAKNYIEQYYSERVDLTELSRTLGYSYDYFRHLFKKYTGYSPMQYVVQQRLEQAKRMLAEDRHPITVIAAECGFSNSPQFSMLFKKYVGVSPSRFRALCEKI